MILRASRPGRLPGPSGASLGQATLPQGVLVAPNPDFASKPASTPVLWVTEERVPKLGRPWREVASSFEQHGLWPLVLESLNDANYDGRPWLAGELDTSKSSSPDQHDAARVLEQHWLQVVPVAEEEPAAFEPLKPFGRTFPGLAPAVTKGVRDHSALEAVVAGMKGRLGLVSVVRPADAPAALGWSGPVNHYEDMGKLSAVLRSWEDRFRAYLVGIGFDTLTLAVQRPVRSPDHARAIAAEHFAMCSDNVHQGAGSIERYAKSLVGQRIWRFWWD